MSGTRAPLADRLVPELGLLDATMVVAGSVIGVGIFTTTGLVAAALPHPGLLLAAWLVGGLVSLAGALTNAEMGSALPRAGGDYVYLREAFHPLVGFVAGWLTFFVVFCGTVGTLAAGLAEYLGAFVPMIDAGGASPFVLGPGQAVALAAVWTCTGLSCWGVRESARVQNVVSLTKIGAILAIAVAGPLVGTGSWQHLGTPAAATSTPGAPGLVTAGALALVPILYAYLGWNAPVYVASELRDPTRTLPRALLLGTLLVTALYLVLNAVYLYAVPVEAMFTTSAGGRREGVVRVADVAARALFGPAGGTIASALVLVSVVGCLNATVLVGARVVYAMALDRTLPLWLASVHPARGTPHAALLAQAAVASVLLVTGTFDEILTFTTFAVITLMVLDGLALFRLRRVLARPAPYRVWGYPWTSALYVAASLGLWLNTLVARPVESAVGLAIAATAVPVYLLGHRRGRRGPH